MGSPRAPGCLGFHTICRSCNRIVAVRSDGVDYRIEEHQQPRAWYHPQDLSAADLICPHSQLQWEDK